MRIDPACFLACAALAASLSAGASESPTFVNVAGVPVRAPAAPVAGNPDIEKLLARPADLWQRMRDGFAMQPLDHPLVREQERAIATRPEQLRAILERGRKYLHYIVEETEQRRLPLELALLPVVESGFNPMAESPARAAGLWQFIPGTGARYGLEQNRDLDARRDVIASTAAALDYLTKLHSMFGDWQLALAAYNWGENAVERAVERARAAGKEATFGALALPEETRHYVPRLMALRNIVADPAAFGVALEEIPNEPFFGTVALGTGVDVPTAARLASMAEAELRALNPALNRGGARATLLVLPVEKIEEFRRNLAAYEATQRQPRPRLRR